MICKHTFFAWGISLALSFHLFLCGSAIAAPRFDGLKEALAAPGAAVLRWDRAAGDKKDGAIKYRLYMNGPGGTKVVGEVSASEWVVLDLEPGTKYQFIVRAKDASGEDNNTRSMAVTPTGGAPQEEWRGVWVNRFEWPGGSLAEIKSRTSAMMKTLADANMNAVVLQVRGQGDTLYPSPDEPWSTLVKGDARQGDPVAVAIETARANGLQVHGWINLSTIWQSGAKELPKDKSHPLYKFADASNPQARAGLIHDSKGNPKQFGSDSYVWLTPGNPAVNAYLRRQVIYFLKRYKVDGIHIDDRTGMPNGVSKDPVSIQRFNGRGNPHRIADLHDWQLDQLSRFLSNVYVQTKAQNPRVMLTAGPFGIADKNRLPGYQRFSDCKKFGVEPEKWMELGVVDALMPQIYWGPDDKEPNFGPLARDWMKHNRTNRPIWPGSTMRSSDKQPLSTTQRQYVAVSRALKLNGNQFYSYGGATPAEWRKLRTTTYPNKARVPTPPHMRPGRTGQIMGVVKDAAGRPVVDCWVKINGSGRIHLTSGDGFFGIPNVPAGNYTIYFSPADGSTLQETVAVEPDRTTMVEKSIK